MMLRSMACIGLFALLTSCSGSTGSSLVSFRVSAAGPANARGSDYAFTTATGFTVTLTKATLRVGAIYLNRSVSISGAQETNCILPGVYVGQVVEGFDADLLSPEPQFFPVNGEGIGERAVTAEVWLTGGDVNAETDPTPIVDVAGVARRGNDEYPFEGSVTISKNRREPTDDPSRPGSNPICKQRIISPIAVDIVPRNGGELRLEVDPAEWFKTIDFSLVEKVSQSPLRYRFEDSNESETDATLYRRIRSAVGYKVYWQQ